MEYLNERLSRKRALEARTMRFAVSVFKLLDSLPLAQSFKIVGSQIGRAASSIGANYREANRAESRDDFTHKIGIVLKECSETVYWLEILASLNANSETIAGLLAEATELTRIFQSANRSLRENKVKSIDQANQ